jgi:hypothetical protein
MAGVRYNVHTGHDASTWLLMEGYLSMDTITAYKNMNHNQRMVYLDMRRGEMLRKQIKWGSQDNRHFHWWVNHMQWMRDNGLVN